MASGSGSYGTAVQIEIKEPVRGKTEPYDSFPVGCKPIVKHRNGFVGAKFGWRQIAEIDHAIAHCSQDAFLPEISSGIRSKRPGGSTPQKTCHSGESAGAIRI